MVGVDCEMVETTCGYELARITVVSEEGATLYDELVRPDNKIVNFHTKYSGITFRMLFPSEWKQLNQSNSSGTTSNSSNESKSASNKVLNGDDSKSEAQMEKNGKTEKSGKSEESVEKEPKTLKMVQKELCTYISAETIICGHGLENDLLALQCIHERVLDTALLYPTFDPDRKHKLKYLAQKHLQRRIQLSTSFNVKSKVALDTGASETQKQLLALAKNAASGTNDTNGTNGGSIKKNDEEKKKDVVAAKSANMDATDATDATNAVNGNDAKSATDAADEANGAIGENGNDTDGVERIGHCSEEDALAALDLVKLKLMRGPKFAQATKRNYSIFTVLNLFERKSMIIARPNLFKPVELFFVLFICYVFCFKTCACVSYFILSVLLVFCF